MPSIKDQEFTGLQCEEEYEEFNGFEDMVEVDEDVVLENIPGKRLEDVPEPWDRRGRKFQTWKFEVWEKNSCTPCYNAGEVCEKLSGKSITCDRCRLRRQSCFWTTIRPKGYARGQKKKSVLRKRKRQFSMHRSAHSVHSGGSNLSSRENSESKHVLEEIGKMEGELKKMEGKCEKMKGEFEMMVKELRVVRRKIFTMVLPGQAFLLALTR